MGHQIFEIESFFVIRREALPHEVFEVFREGLQEVDAVAPDFLDQLLFAAASPGGLAMKHFVNDHPNRPNVVFNGIDVAVECFRTHVQGRPHIHCLLGVGTSPFGEPEVGNLDCFVL